MLHTPAHSKDKLINCSLCRFKYCDHKQHVKTTKWKVSCKQNLHKSVRRQHWARVASQTVFLRLIWVAPMGIYLWTLTVAGAFLFYLVIQDNKLLLLAEATTESAYCAYLLHHYYKSKSVLKGHTAALSLCLRWLLDIPCMLCRSSSLMVFEVKIKFELLNRSFPRTKVDHSK